MPKDLNELSSEELGMLFPIIITDHNPEWKNLFQKEKERIQNAVGTDVIFRIEHIGSTAISNIKAKPTIDILLEIKKKANNKFIISSLKKCGYHFISKPENPPPHMMFVKGYSPSGFSGQAYHIHVRYKGDWDELYFRNYLQRNPKIAQAYEKLKVELAKKYKHDRDGYTDAKSSFINQVIKKARRK